MPLLPEYIRSPFDEPSASSTVGCYLDDVSNMKMLPDMLPDTAFRPRLTLQRAMPPLPSSHDDTSPKPTNFQLT